MNAETFAGVNVGPDDFLVLVPRGGLSPEQCLRISQDIPESLQGRVIVTSEMDAYVIHPEVGVLSCGCVPPCEGHERDES